MFRFPLNAVILVSSNRQRILVTCRPTCRMMTSLILIGRVLCISALIDCVFSPNYANETIYVRKFAIANPSVVCNRRAPYPVCWNFRQCHYTILYLSHPLTSNQNFTEMIPGKHFRPGLYARGLAKYSDFGPVKDYISETVQNTASYKTVQLKANRKS